MSVAHLPRKYSLQGKGSWWTATHTFSLQTERAGSTAAVFSNLSVTQETAPLWTAHWECTWSCCRRDFKNGFLVFLKNKPDLIPEATKQPPVINIIRKRILSLLRKGSISRIQAPTSEQRGKEENGSSEREGPSPLKLTSSQTQTTGSYTSWEAGLELHNWNITFPKDYI